jgi:hypothetical protein
MAKEIQICLSEGIRQIATIGWVATITAWQSLFAHPGHGFSDERSRNLIDSQGDASLSLGRACDRSRQTRLQVTRRVAVAACALKAPRIGDERSRNVVHANELTRICRLRRAPSLPECQPVWHATSGLPSDFRCFCKRSRNITDGNAFTEISRGAKGPGGPESQSRWTFWLLTSDS